MQGCIHFTLPAVLTFPRSTFSRSLILGLWMREIQLAVSQGASCSSQMGTLLVWKLVHQHYFFISSQGTALMETGFTHNFICKGMHPNRPSGIQYHFCVLCGPDRQACLCTALCPTHLSLCQKHLVPGNGLKASGAHRGTFRTLSHTQGFSDLPCVKVTSFRCGIPRPLLRNILLDSEHPPLSPQLTGVIGWLLVLNS